MGSEENFYAWTKEHETQFQEEVWLVTAEKAVWMQRRNVLASEKKLSFEEVVSPQVVIHLRRYGSKCLCSRSVYNDRLTKESIMKQSFP